MNEAFWINHQQAHQNFGCGLVDIGNNNLSKLQGQCEKTIRIKVYEEHAKHFLQVP
jgi:hypothetical protein